MSTAITAWTRLSDKPLGKRIFSRAVARRAPYLSTIGARFLELRPNHATLLIPKRRRVLNHLGTVHAIALCNGLEAVAAMLAEASVPPDRRWIPVGMEVRYPAAADSAVECVAETDQTTWDADTEDVPVHVYGVRADGRVVIDGTIHLRVTAKNPASDGSA